MLPYGVLGQHSEGCLSMGTTGGEGFTGPLESKESHVCIMQHQAQAMKAAVCQRGQSWSAPDKS